MSADYHVFMFDQLRKYLKDQIFWHLLALGLSLASEGEIHKQCSCVLQAIFG